jgi:peptidylprolyl isomerase
MNRAFRTLVHSSLVLTLIACNQKGEQKSTTEKPATEKPAAAASVAAASAAAMPAAPKEIPAPADVAAPPADATKSVTGVASKVLTPGTGTTHPTPNDTVEVHYTGWTKAGVMFDTSVGGNSARFPLGRVIKGWTEGMQLMVEGEKRRFWIPAELAYGEVPTRPGAPAGQLTFDVELIKIIPAPTPPPVPEDVKAAPASAKTTASGLKYRTLSKGTGTQHPTAMSRVEVHYSGWTTDGKMFDSSVMRGNPAQFGLNQVIKGWTEGVQLMVEGEKARFWIPGKLAYGDTPQPGRPSGTLVFDIELIKIMGAPTSPH